MFENKSESENANNKKLDNEFLSGIENANLSDKNDGPSVVVVDAVKPKCELPKLLIRFIVDRKNSIEASIISKDLDDDAKAFIHDYLKTTPEEIAVWKEALEQTGDQHLPVEYIELIRKYLASPLFKLVESEFEKLSGLRGALSEFKKTKAVA